MSDYAFTMVQLHYFATSAERGSMTAAARELHVSQSAISTAIAQLEKQLGVQLLLRHHARGLTLTAAGTDFLRELRSFLAHASDLEEAARGAGASLVGDLSVGWFSTLAPFSLPGLSAAFEKQYPQVHLQVLEGEHEWLRRAVREGRCELSVMYGYDLDDLEYQVIASVEPYAIVSSTHRLAKRKRVSLSELVTEPMILLDLPHTADYFTSMFSQSTGEQPNVRFRSPGFETVRALVAHGHGFALLNQRPAFATTYDGESVVTLEVKDDVEPLEVVVAWARGVRLTRRAASFVRFARSNDIHR